MKSKCKKVLLFSIPIALFCFLFGCVAQKEAEVKSEMLEVSLNSKIR